MKIIRDFIIFLCLSMLLIGCRSTNDVKSNEEFFDANINKFQRLTDEEVNSLTNDITLRHFEKDYHGNQIEYNSIDGRTYLWYPINKKLVAGFFKVKDNRVICFNYQGNVKNTFTGEVGGVWNCQPLSIYISGIKEKKNHNVFQFNESRKVPFILNDFPEETIPSLLEKLH
ncbi:hypothetical protein [Leptospira sp. GIMC2001]|uniref:hypothetical protein n=1 Tax=Leptospira sp. GIMC2001 TaxID=1513297 RepID=UPI00234AFAB6|nr:hypothetical protein [Leptospira sp. GIMC2001]WCL50625.1 hypothetical protein O4O04_07360 [Leptospira sp. GIMC2001]